MRKLKKNVLSSNVTRLSNHEQQFLVGGMSKSTGCEDKSQDQCSGSCSADGYSGTCGWTYANYNRCTCAVVYIG